MAFFSGAIDSWRAAGISRHLLLLSQSLLPGVFLDPPACAVPERKRNYTGETRFPFILQNMHRYFLYLAVIFLAFLWHDAISAFFFPSGFGIGVGTLVLLVNVILLSLYTFSCHSLRHLVGGKVDCFSCVEVRQARVIPAWKSLSFLNEHHMLFAWMSLILGRAC